VETIKAERDAIESELMSATADMKSKSSMHWHNMKPSVSRQCLWRIWGWYTRMDLCIVKCGSKKLLRQMFKCVKSWDI